MGVLLRCVVAVALLLAVALPAHAQSLQGPTKRGGASLTGVTSLSFAAITPATINASTNNYNPGVSNRFKVSASAAYSITGWVAAADGWVMCLENVGSFAITLPHNSGSSDAANRWQNGAGGDVVLQAGGGQCWRYSTTATRWVLNATDFGDTSASSLTNAGTGTCGGVNAGSLCLSDPAGVTMYVGSLSSGLRIKNTHASGAGSGIVFSDSYNTDQFTLGISPSDVSYAATSRNHLFTGLNFDVRTTGGIVNGGSATCFTGVTGAVCVPDADGIAVAPASGSAIVSLRLGTTNTFLAAIDTYDQGNARMGTIGSFGAGLSAGYAGKTGMFTRTTYPTFAGATADFNASSPVFEVRDGTSFADLDFAVYGTGVVKWRPNTAAAGITCNSSNEGMEYVRVIAASNKSGKCLCTQTSSGAYAWTISYTGGGTPLVAGDC